MRLPKLRGEIGSVPSFLSSVFSLPPVFSQFLCQRRGRAQIGCSAAPALEHGRTLSSVSLRSRSATRITRGESIAAKAEKHHETRNPERVCGDCARSRGQLRLSPSDRRQRRFCSEDPNMHRAPEALTQNADGSRVSRTERGRTQNGPEEGKTLTGNS